MSDLVVAQLLPALNNGGVERGTVEVANYIAAGGNTSLVISAGGTMCQQLFDGVEHISLNIGKKSPFSYFLIHKLKTLFIDKKVDVVHCRSRFPAWLAYLAIKKIKGKKPLFITTIHGLYTVKRYSSIMARGDKVIAVSQTAADYIQKNYPKDLKSKPIIIHRGIDPNKFTYSFEPDVLWLQKWYEKHHQLVGHQMVLLPGRLTRLKGAKDLLPWLKSKDNDAKLVLTADPEHDMFAARLYHWFKEQGVDHRVHWVEIQHDIAPLYAIADVVVSASTRPESFGRTVIEALAIGTPVVGYNHGGVGEILGEVFEQGKIEVGNCQQLAQRINQFLTSKPKVRNKQPYLLENMLSQTHKLYQDALNAN